MYSVSRVIDGATYTISGGSLARFLNNYVTVEGTEGLAARIETVAHEVAAEAIAPIAATAQPSDAEVARDASDDLADLIRNAPDRNTLTVLWRQNKDKWADYNHLAVERGKELDKIKAKESK
jgi:hypothetical protein